MAYYNLDKNGKRSNRSKAAKKSKGRHTFYHYEIVVWKTVQGQRKQLRRRGWYRDDGEAEDAELKLKAAPLTEGATWSETRRAFMEAFNGKRSPIYLRDIGRALNRFIDLQGDQPVASTQIADVVPLFDSLKSRAAQTTHSRMNTVRGSTASACINQSAEAESSSPNLSHQSVVSKLVLRERRCSSNTEGVNNVRSIYKRPRLGMRHPRSRLAAEGFSGRVCVRRSSVGSRRMVYAADP